MKKLKKEHLNKIFAGKYKISFDKKTGQYTSEVTLENGIKRVICQGTLRDVIALSDEYEKNWTDNDVKIWDHYWGHKLKSSNSGRS